MKAIKLSNLIVLALIQTITSMVLAQCKPKAGDTISGKVTCMVSDSIVPLGNVSVFELESDSYIVEFHLTDTNGIFSFPVSNPDNKILIQAIGYKYLILPLDRQFYDIRLEEGEDEQPYIFEIRIHKKGNEKPIPLREASKDVKTIDMNQFNHLM